MKEKTMKLFPFTEVFTFSRGKRLIEEDQVPGDIAYISSTKNNNGISGYINPPDFMVRYKNKITLSNSGSVGYCFYHDDYEFVASDHATVIGIKDTSVQLTKNIAIYLKPILESFRYKYNFGREISDTRLAAEYVLLPGDEFNSPDWAYMEEYIEELSSTVNWEGIRSAQVGELLRKDNWKNFRMDEIFNFFKGKRLTKENMTAGKTNFIGAISIDNGIRQKIDEDPLYQGNCITVNYNGSVGKAFFQKEPFWASDDVNVLYLKEEVLNIYTAMFLITIIEQNKVHFDFGRKWNTEKMKATLIYLPTNNQGAPDLKYMESYIKSLPHGDKI